jgi:antitoxin (DNA-binding transcriptional repressor) of toxin-antitoxin stability system
VTTHSVADVKNRLPELIDRALEGEESSSRVHPATR